MRLMTLEEIDRQHLRSYPADRTPGLGLDRNAPGESGKRRARTRAGRCRECHQPILGRPSTAKTCLLHREYPALPNRVELAEMVAEYEALVESLRVALASLDEEDGR